MTYHYVSSNELKADPNRWLAAAHGAPVLIRQHDSLVLVLVEYDSSRDRDVDFTASLPFMDPDDLDECLAAARIAPVLVKHENTALVLSSFAWPRDGAFPEFIGDQISAGKLLVDTNQSAVAPGVLVDELLARMETDE